jgi:exosome complex component RRP42
MSSKEHLIKSLDAGIRFDGRKLDELRKITVETGVSKKAEGSARVVIGDTEVLAGVKLAVEPPYPDTPKDGKLMVNVELLPLSNPKYEPGPPSSESIEVARIVDRGIRESKFIERDKLCMAPKEAVWSVMIDAITINSHGNVIDAAALAAVAAVGCARLPKYEDGAVRYDELTDEKLPLSINDLPISVTVHKIGKHLLVDPLPEEEEHTDARLTIALVADDSLVTLQKGGNQTISPDEIAQMVSLAKSKAEELSVLVK